MSVDQVVELDVSGVDKALGSDLVLLLLLGGDWGVDPAGDELGSPGDISVLLWVGLGDQGEDVGELVLEGLSGGVLVGVFHPDDRVEVSEARTNVDSSDGGLGSAVASP